MQHLVGLGNLLEAILGPRVLVDVRVVLAGELAVCAADVVGVGVAGNAECLVVILVSDGHQLSPAGRRDTTTWAGRKVPPSLRPKPERATSSTVWSGTSVAGWTAIAS